MALCSLTTRKLDIPHEPGQWVEIRPLSTAALREAIKQALEVVGGDDLNREYGYELTARMLRVAIVSWSYEPMPDDKTIADLDLKTTRWLSDQLSGGAEEVPLPITSPSTDSSQETETE